MRTKRAGPLGLRDHRRPWARGRRPVRRGRWGMPAPSRGGRPRSRVPDAGPWREFDRGMGVLHRGSAGRTATRRRDLSAVRRASARWCGPHRTGNGVARVRWRGGAVVQWCCGAQVLRCAGVAVHGSAGDTECSGAPCGASRNRSLRQGDCGLVGGSSTPRADETSRTSSKFSGSSAARPEHCRPIEAGVGEHRTAEPDQRTGPARRRPCTAPNCAFRTPAHWRGTRRRRVNGAHPARRRGAVYSQAGGEP